jgi:hypothetical protein
MILSKTTFFIDMEGVYCWICFRFASKIRMPIYYKILYVW